MTRAGPGTTAQCHSLEQVLCRVVILFSPLTVVLSTISVSIVRVLIVGDIIISGLSARELVSR